MHSVGVCYSDYSSLLVLPVMLVAGVMYITAMSSITMPPLSVLRSALTALLALDHKWVFTMLSFFCAETLQTPPVCHNGHLSWPDTWNECRVSLVLYSFSRQLCLRCALPEKTIVGVLACCFHLAFCTALHSLWSSAKLCSSLLSPVLLGWSLTWARCSCALSLGFLVLPWHTTSLLLISGVACFYLDVFPVPYYKLQEGGNCFCTPSI